MTIRHTKLESTALPSALATAIPIPTGKRMMKRLAVLLIPTLTVGSLTAAAQGDNWTTKSNGSEYQQPFHDGRGGPAHQRAIKVLGRGTVTMEATADDTEYGVFQAGDLFADNRFGIRAIVNADGSARGSATFAFGEAFSAPWGAELITLYCEIDTGTVYETGIIVLQGLSFEEDFVDGVVTFEELSPFEIMVGAAGSFSLRWCKLPAFDLEITRGHLKGK